MLQRILISYLFSTMTCVVEWWNVRNSNAARWWYTKEFLGVIIYTPNTVPLLHNSYWQMLLFASYNNKEQSTILSHLHFLVLGVDDNYMNMSDTKNIQHNGTCVKQKEDEEEEDNLQANLLHLYEEKRNSILHMPPQFLWTKVTSQPIIYPWAGTIIT